MPAAIKYNKFVHQLGLGLHDFGVDQLKVLLSNTLPDATDTDVLSMAEIAAGNGYTAGGQAVVVSWTEVDGVATLNVSNPTFTAVDGPIAEFQWAILYNVASNRAISAWDYGSKLNLQATESVTIDLGNVGHFS